MTHNMTNPEKYQLFKEVKDMVLYDILQREDAEEIYKIIHKACNRIITSIDDPTSVKEQ